jgi:homoserine dehydrogenase
MASNHRVPVIFLGVGNIGRTLLRQILEGKEVVARRTGLLLAPIVLADVSGVLLDPAGLPEEMLRAALEVTANGKLLKSVPGIQSLDRVIETLRPGVILVDMTATPKTMPTLLAAIETECGIVLANKIPLTTNWGTAEAFFEYPYLRYECTVGAGLPVIKTLRCLLDTDDEVEAIEGCLSGTLNYLCTRLEHHIPYSDAIAEAHDLGYTEPDPRDDLSGKDIARKVLILARTAGWEMEEADLTVEALYTESLANISVEEFMVAAPSLDVEYATRVRKAQSMGRTLRYVAHIDPEGSTVGLKPVDRDSPLGTLRGSDNYIALYTARYDESPLVISGPGAGPEVTAAGVMGDIIELAHQMIKK